MNNSGTKQEHVLIGKIVGIHGIKGTNKLRSYAESLSVFSPGRSILVRDLRGREASYEIHWVKPHTGTPLVSFKGIANRDQAKTLIGAELFIPQSELPELDEDTYYWYDLIGIEVVTVTGESLGRIESIIETGSNDVYVVKSNETEVLIPALESVVLEIDLEHKRMQVDLPEGLD
ncbi:MAG: ribosome maturation factor RimM [Desulfobacteraceae bacterium]|nr:ribosome maturation factor RimM [Desulfobacteraceae bacterium]